jgi:hypothetical protein
MELLTTKKIGEAAFNQGYTPSDAYYNTYTPQKGKTPRIVDIALDMYKNEVRVEATEAFEDLNSESIKRDHLFSTLNGRFTNYYLTMSNGKQDGILKFLTIENGTVAKDENVKVGEKSTTVELLAIKKDVKAVQDAGFISDTFLQTELFQLRDTIRAHIQQTPFLGKHLALVIENLKVIVGANKKDFEKKFPPAEFPNLRLLGFSVSGKGSKDDIAYIRFKVVTADGKLLLPFRLQEYKELHVARLMSFSAIKKDTQTTDYCYFSGEENAQPISFPRDATNLLKVKTGKPNEISSSKSCFEGSDFVLSLNTYNQLKFGAKFLDTHKWKVPIAGIEHYILPDTSDDFQLHNANIAFKDAVDIAFQIRRDVLRDVRTDIREIAGDTIHSLTFLGVVKNKTQGTITIINRIQDVPSGWFNHIVKTLYNLAALWLSQDGLNLGANHKWIGAFTLGHSYFLFPERYVKDGNRKKPLNKPQTLAFFKLLFERQPIDKTLLFDMYRQLILLYRFGRKDSDGKYSNTLNIQYPSPKSGAYSSATDSDFYIAQATLKYLFVLHLIQQLYHPDLPTQTRTTAMNMEKPFDNEKTTKLFDALHLNDAQRAMFYLGKLVRRVALGQVKQGHKHKPILAKINYAGMNLNEIPLLFLEVVEKMEQYNKSQNVFNFGEADIRSFHSYFNIAKEAWTLSETENIFYLFTGYGLYWDCADEVEKKNLKTQGIEPDMVDVGTDVEQESEENTDDDDSEEEAN